MTFLTFMNQIILRVFSSFIFSSFIFCFYYTIQHYSFDNCLFIVTCIMSVIGLFVETYDHMINRISLWSITFLYIICYPIGTLLLHVFEETLK